MMRASIALVTTPTRLQGLMTRWGTKGAAKFRLAQSDQHFQEQLQHGQATATGPQKRTNSPKTSKPTINSTFSDYESEDKLYQETLEVLRRKIDIGFPIHVIEKRYLANFDFRNVVMVVVVGHDGLVANTAKYAQGLPIIGVNPDPSRNSGVLTPFSLHQVQSELSRSLAGRSITREVTLAEANLNDGQSMLAFNDFFIGKRTHTSARYRLHYRGGSEPQSSSGVIVSTGAGSTGWLSSVFNMTQGMVRWTGGNSGDPLELQWEDRKLAWVVREPFVSQSSSAQFVAGTIDESEELILESQMPDSGVIFSDGIEEDYLEFNSGSTLRLQVSSTRAKLVVPG